MLPRNSVNLTLDLGKGSSVSSRDNDGETGTEEGRRVVDNVKYETDRRSGSLYGSSKEGLQRYDR